MPADRGYTVLATFTVPVGAEGLQSAEAVEVELRDGLESLGATVILLSVIEEDDEED